MLFKEKVISMVEGDKGKQNKYRFGKNLFNFHYSLGLILPMEIVRKMGLRRHSTFAVEWDGKSDKIVLTRIVRARTKK